MKFPVMTKLWLALTGEWDTLEQQCLILVRDDDKLRSHKLQRFHHVEANHTSQFWP